MHISERSQSEKAEYYMIPTILHSGTGKTMETAKRSAVVKDCGETGMTSQSTENFLEFG